jgi:2-keto-3-deoxy-L-rhamnonate aldolase RhmA
MKNFKQKLVKGKSSIGTFISLGSPIVSEIIGQAGFDFVILDLEHGSGNEKDILGQLQAMTAGTAATIVRIESHERQRAGRVLDLGAEGIMFPRLKSVEEARSAINALYYPPAGSRGVAKMVRASNFGKDFDEYYANQKNNIIGVIQIETREILDCLDEVAVIDGVDVLFVGPMDLSMSLGVFGKFDHPDFLQAIKATAMAAKKANKICGALLTNPDQLSMYYNLGYRFFTSGADIGFINSGARNTVKLIEEALSKVGD